MPQCVFYSKDDPCICRVLSAAAEGVLPSGISSLLAERYCSSGRFIGCPIFQRFERSLQEAHTQLESMRPRDPGHDDSPGYSRSQRRRLRLCN